MSLSGPRRRTVWVGWVAESAKAVSIPILSSWADFGNVLVVVIGQCGPKSADKYSNNITKISLREMPRSRQTDYSFLLIHRTSRSFFEASSSASLSLSTIREALPTRGLPTAAVGAVRGGGVHIHAHRHQREREGGRGNRNP